MNTLQTEVVKRYMQLGVPPDVLFGICKETFEGNCMVIRDIPENAVNELPQGGLYCGYAPNSILEYEKRCQS